MNRARLALLESRDVAKHARDGLRGGMGAATVGAPHARAGPRTEPAGAGARAGACSGGYASSKEAHLLLRPVDVKLGVHLVIDELVPLYAPQRREADAESAVRGGGVAGGPSRALE